MNSYNKRGLTWLLSSIFGVAAGIVLLFFVQTRYIGVSVITVSLLWLVRYFSDRSMTPEQFAEQQKKERKLYDERGMMLAGTTARITIMAMTVSLALGMVLSIILGSREAAFANGGQFFVMCVVIFVVRKILDRRM